MVGLKLLIPKQVEIDNLQLRILYLITQALAFGLLGFRLCFEEQWAQSHDIAEHIDGQIWFVPINADQLQDVWGERAVSDLCQNPGDFDYQYDAEGKWRFVGHSCVPPCGPDVSKTELCANPWDTSVVSGFSDLFFPTQFEERSLGAEFQEAQVFGFLPYEIAHTIELSYKFEVPRPSVFGRAYDFSADDSTVDGSSDSVLTVFVDSEQNVWKTSKPAEPSMSFSVSELLMLMGEPYFLDAPSTALGPNHAEGAAFPDAGFGRITGAHVDLHLECRQQQSRAATADGFMDDSWEGPACYVHAKKRRPWAIAEQLVFSRGSAAWRTAHGIRVQVVTAGTFYFLDFEWFLRSITASLMLLFIPKIIMWVVIHELLGHLSTIYCSAITEKFDVGKEIARITGRLLAASASFVDLADPDNGEAEGHEADASISKETIHATIAEIIRNDKHILSTTLDKGEVARLVDFCYWSMVNVQNFTKGSVFSHPCSTLKHPSAGHHLHHGGKSTIGLSAPSVGIEVFTSACASSEALEFDAFVQLFDKDRKMGYLEGFFTPNYLKNLHPIPDVHVAPPDDKLVSAGELRAAHRDHIHDKHAIVDALDEDFCMLCQEVLGVDADRKKPTKPGGSYSRLLDTQKISNIRGLSLGDKTWPKMRDQVKLDSSKGLPAATLAFFTATQRSWKKLPSGFEEQDVAHASPSNLGGSLAAPGLELVLEEGPGMHSLAPCLRADLDSWLRPVAVPQPAVHSIEEVPPQRSDRAGLAFESTGPSSEEKMDSSKPTWRQFHSPTPPPAGLEGRFTDALAESRARNQTIL